MVKNSDYKKIQWPAVSAVTYGIAGHFIGKEIWPSYGVLFTAAGLFLGFLVSEKLLKLTLVSRVITIALPIILLFSVLFIKFIVSYKVDLNVNGQWIAKTNTTIFTLNIEDKNAFLSAEPGLKKIVYQVNLEGDSLFLKAGENNVLRWCLKMHNDSTVIDAGAELFFKRRQPAP